MSAIREILQMLDETSIARTIAIPHDQARLAYALDSNTVRSFPDFEDTIAAYYAYHFERCISRGGRLSRTEALGRAKEVLDREYRKQHGDVVSAFNDAHDGTNGGLRRILDLIAESMKAESTDRYVRDVFDRYVEPNDFEQKVEIIRGFVRECGPFLSRSIQAERPERYAANYRELVQDYVEGLRRTSAAFRRL